MKLLHEADFPVFMSLITTPLKKGYTKPSNRLEGLVLLTTTMVHLNKNQLTDTQLSALFTQLSSSVSSLPTGQTDPFLSALLGQEEKIMLAKRLATIVFLIEGKSLYNISHTLKISPSTAENIKQKLNNGTYDAVLEALGKNKKDYFTILKTLDSILHLGGILPHYNGLDRYRGL